MLASDCRSAASQVGRARRPEASVRGTSGTGETGQQELAALGRIERAVASAISFGFEAAR